VTQVVQTSELPAGVNALASADGKTIIVRAGLDSSARRRALREVLAATHRFPALALYPALADARIRRFAVEAADALSGLVQHAAGLLAPDSPIAAMVVSAAVVAAGAGVTVGVATGTIPAPSSPFTAAHGPAPPSASKRVHRRVTRMLAPYPDSYLGVYEAGAPRSYTPVIAFAHAIGHIPNLALYYSGWGEPFNVTFAAAARASGATPVIQMDPDGKNVSLAAIASGASRTYLENFAHAVNDYGQPVVIGFGHEMNASTYPWGHGHTPPADFVAAWRYIVTLFRGQGDYNVTWLWTININTPQTGPMSDWWPGDNFVTWVGIDGYYFSPAGTFTSVFGPTIADVNAITSKPILISETGADPPQSSEVRQIRGLFGGIRRRQILGFIWYDEPGHTGRDWRLEDNAPAMRAFRRAARGYRSEGSHGQPPRPGALRRHHRPDSVRDQAGTGPGAHRPGRGRRPGSAAGDNVLTRVPPDARRRPGDPQPPADRRGREAVMPPAARVLAPGEDGVDGDSVLHGGRAQLVPGEPEL
jgi:hypothetical protein